MGEQETGRAAADNSNLGVHGCGSIFIKRLAKVGDYKFLQNPCIWEMTGVESSS
jgi:hypothetical protein